MRGVGFALLAVLAPRGTGADVINRLNAEARKALALHDVRKQFAQASLLPVGNSPKEFGALIASDVERWTALAKSLGLEPQ